MNDIKVRIYKEVPKEIGIMELKDFINNRIDEICSQ